MKLKLLLILITMCLANTAMAKTYYVSVTGNDSNLGTAESPWANPQKCVDPGSPLRAGDTCEVANGNYTSMTSGRVVFAGASAPAGSPGMLITIRAANPGGVRIEIPETWPGLNCDTSQCPFSGFYMTRPYYSIEGFDIVREGPSLGQKATLSGIVLAPSHGSVVRRNDIHHIGRNVCHNGGDASGNGNQGILLLNSMNVTVEKNRIFSIGRQRNGENGCVTNKEAHDHAINAVGTMNLMVRRNLIWDSNRGMAINIKAPAGQTAGTKIYHNTIVGSSPTGRPGQQILLGNILQDIQIINNIFYDPPNGYAIGLTSSAKVVNPPGMLVSHNLTNSLRDEANFTNPSHSVFSGITYKDNITGVNPSFVSLEINEFRVRSGSRAIDNGMRLSGVFVSDSTPDIGAYPFGTKEPLGTGTAGAGSGSATGMSRPPGCI